VLMRVPVLAADNVCHSGMYVFPSTRVQSAQTNGRPVYPGKAPCVHKGRFLPQRFTH